ncbi:DUF6266 family protein [Chryseobacterium indoltheticum]|uniref:Uncharacterized protein n=1 Tax=Chryseobacterium indoltheticum TaxID=254 RepID=A0A381FG74_9FLAO|nr:DUF6266 family protein [Chryseobacterium indoltheticum]AZA74548.1 hypothetical protein EG358_12595 [Chryseobacterium indoltheticum]SIQ08591.1 hypothetical protein SAMN05421682_102294 [Chryseobacterium indoltheticum]SUX45565.1 Uncharacterised protein [Chryseobacterium indoltheticum]
MAIISGALFSQAKGSVGNLTLSTQKGRVIMKSKASVVSNPNTSAQQRQRAFISKAVIAWKLLGNVLKSGITSLVQYGSQYNTYVSKNAQHFTTAMFDINSMAGGDLIGSFATIGARGELSYSLVSKDTDSVTLSINNSTLKNTANIGDVLKLVIGDTAAAEFSYSELEITQSMLENAVTTVTFNDLSLPFDSMLVSTLWSESSDMTQSNTSKFKLLLS